MSTMVNIEGLSKADVLAALFNASAPAGMGFLQAANGPQVMNSAYAQELLDLGSDASGDYPNGMAAMRRNAIYFDYLYGRSPSQAELVQRHRVRSVGFRP